MLYLHLKLSSTLSKANKVTPVLTSLSPPPFSPTGWDPLSFLPSTPIHRTANGHCFSPMTATKSPYRTRSEGQAFRLQQKRPVQREQSLDISLGSFCDPFENDSNHLRHIFSLSDLLLYKMLDLHSVGSQRTGSRFLV